MLAEFKKGEEKPNVSHPQLEADTLLGQLQLQRLKFSTYC